MTNRPPRPGLRRAVRALALTPATVLLAGAGPALADPPATWETSDPVSSVHTLLVLGAVPLGLFLLITLLVYLPSMRHGESSELWRGQSEWFGGPRGGLATADRTAPPALPGGHATGAESEVTPGGISGRW